MDSAIIKEQALHLGFEFCGIARSGVLDSNREQVMGWLGSNMNGTMSWLERNVDVRTNPALLFEGTKSVIVVLLNYFPESVQAKKDAPLLSKYAYGQDYHKVIKKKLKKLIAFIHDIQPEGKSRAFVDSAPVMEKKWAQRAGLGWTGKHSVLITPKAGSYFFIGIILTTLELDYDEPYGNDGCGSCSRCMDACPTKAIVNAGVVDARKCLSYITVELKGELNHDLHERVFGCDICQDVCPWNRFSQPTKVEEFRPHPRMLSMNREEWRNLGEEEFNNIFKGTPVERAGFAGLKRNLQHLGKVTTSD